MKLGFAKFLMIVAFGAAVSAAGGAALSSAQARTTESPSRVEVRILETAVVCEAHAVPMPL